MKKSNPGFSKLLKRYQQEQCSEEEKLVIDQWFNSVHHEIADQPFADDQQDQIMQRMWENIQSANVDRDEDEILPLRNKWWRSWPARIAAACLFILIGFGIYESRIKNQIGSAVIAGKDVSEMTELTNDQSVPKIVKLPDNSLVTLETGSSLYYNENFGSERREVYLKGSGFFEVSHNKEKPFLVFAGKIVTRVVGTSFTIRQNVKNLEVAVMTGKVIVEKTGNGLPGVAGVMLTPNQKVIYNTESQLFETGLVNEPVLLKPKQGLLAAAAFNFDDTPLSDVISILETSYGIEILIRNEQIKTCPVKADLSQQPLYAKLDIICAALKSHYDVKGTTIIITGGQCE